MSEINVAQPPLSDGYETVSGMGHLLGYARVSTTDQHPQLQVDALERAGCYRVFVETASGARSDRPVLEQLLDQLRPGDTLVVWKLDRLGRSLRHTFATWLEDAGVPARVIDESMGHEATSRAGQQRGSAMGAHYRHTTPEMATRIATAIEQRLTVVSKAAEQALEAQPSRSTQRVF